MDVFNPSLGGLLRGSLPRLKLVRIMLETSNLTGKYTPFSAKALLILLISAFFCKYQRFFSKNSTFTQSNSVTAVLEIF